MSTSTATSKKKPKAPGRPPELKIGPFQGGIGVAVWLNEVQPNNVTGITDRFGHHHPWVELHNSSASAINLGGYYLANNYTNLTQWAFPTNTLLDPGQFLVVYLDGNPGESVSTELHTSFVIPPVSGSVALTKVAGARTTIVDYLNYNLLNADRRAVATA